MEDLSKSRSDIRPIAFPDIPTPDEHAKEVRRIFQVCAAVAAIIGTLSIAGITIALLHDIPPQVVAFGGMLTMNVAVVTFGAGYAIPVGLVSLKRLELTLRMGYKGLTMNQEVTSSVRSMVKDVRPIVKKIDENLDSIASKIRRDTAPLPIRERVTTGD